MALGSVSLIDTIGNKVLLLVHLESQFSPGLKHCGWLCQGLQAWPVGATIMWQGIFRNSEMTESWGILPTGYLKPSSPSPNSLTSSLVILNFFHMLSFLCPTHKWWFS